MKNLTEGSMGKNFALFSLPAILSGFLGLAYSTIDSIIAGRFLGESSFAAISSTASLHQLIYMLFVGYTLGASVYTARLFGEKNYEKLRNNSLTNFFFCFVAPLFISLVAILFCDPILDFLNVSGFYRHEAKIYFIVLMASFSVQVTNQLGGVILASMGNSSYGLYLRLISSAINIGGNLLSVTVLDWGIGGIAFFTGFSDLVVTVFYLWRLRKFYQKVLPKTCKAKISFRELRDSFSYTSVSVLQQGSLFVVDFVASPSINALGGIALAAKSIFGSLAGWVTNCYSCAGKTVSNYSAQCMGVNKTPAEKKAMLRRAVLVGLGQSLLFGGILMIPIMIFPEFFASFFLTDAQSAQSIPLAVSLVRTMLPLYVTYAVSTLLHSFLRGVKALWTLYGVSIFATVVQLILIFPLVARFGIYGSVLSRIFSWLAEDIVMIVIYLTEKWIPNEWKSKKTNEKTDP